MAGRLPIGRQARLMVTFRDIGINTDKRLFRGEVVFVEEVSIDELLERMPKKKAAHLRGEQDHSIGLFVFGLYSLLWHCRHR
jgi:hypothetical protein